MAKKIETVVLVLIIVALFFVIKPFLMDDIPIVNSVQIDQPIVDVLNDKFSNSQVEFALCLNGQIINGVAIIDKLIEPESSELVGQDQLSVRCPKGIIGTIHSHPNRICTMSLQDSYTFGKSGLPISGVMCGGNNIKFYTPESLKNSVDVEFSN